MQAYDFRRLASLACDIWGRVFHRPARQGTASMRSLLGTTVIVPRASITLAMLLLFEVASGWKETWKAA